MLNIFRRRILARVVCLALAAAPFAPGGEPPRAVPTAGWCTLYDTSPPLREMLTRPCPRGWDSRERLNPSLEEEEGIPEPPGPAAADPVLQTTFGGLRMPGPLRSFAGIGNVSGTSPADTNGDIGPSHYIQWVNTVFGVFDRFGNLTYGPSPGNILWSGFGGLCEATNNGDPIALYDPLADRWMMSQFAFQVDGSGIPVGPYAQCIAVSATGDPLGSYHRYEFVISPNRLPDYPKFGVWPDAYYYAATLFGGGSNAGVAAFERAAMLDGQPARIVYFDLGTVDARMRYALPADLDGPAPPPGTPNPYLTAGDDQSGYPSDQLQVWEFAVDWADTGSSTFTQVAILPVAAFDGSLCGGMACVPQKDTAQRLDTIGGRLMYKLQYRNFGAYETLVTTHSVDADGNDRAGVRWYELRRLGGAWSVRQQGTWAPGTEHRWMGSAALDQSGGLAVGYSVSGSGLFPGIRYAGRLNADPLGQLSQGESTLANGAGSQTGVERWGDYSSMSVDPVDDCTFWFTTMYYTFSAPGSWRTRIGSFRFPECGGAVPTDTDGDGAADAEDCAPVDPTQKAPPADVTNLRVRKDASRTPPRVRMDWDSQVGSAGSAVNYDILTNTWITWDPADPFGLPATCLAQDVPVNGGNIPGAFNEDGANDVRRWYLVRASLPTCGLGTYGDSTLLPDPRDALDAGGACP